MEGAARLTLVFVLGAALTMGCDRDWEIFAIVGDGGGGQGGAGGGVDVCGPTCGIEGAVSDGLDNQWDPVLRDPLSRADASAACAAVGARLPTVTEMAARYAEVLPPSGVWTGIRDGATSYVSITRDMGGMVVRESVDGSELLSFLCICPADVGLGAASCAGDACFQLPSQRLLDEDFRPALNHNAAIFECAQYGAHIADLPTQLVRDNLETSGVTLSELRSVTDVYRVRGENLGSFTLEDREVLMSGQFACAGLIDPCAADVAMPTTGFDGGLNRNRIDDVDRAAADWDDALVDCFQSGGHLPTAAELLELIQRDLPPSMMGPLWTASPMQWNPSTQLMLDWSSSADAYDVSDGGARTTRQRGEQAAYRCIYYPVDASFTAPPANASCDATSCPSYALGTDAGTEPRMWLDADNQGPSFLDGALSSCAARGGHLASERDIAELVLSTGNQIDGGGARILTSTLVVDNSNGLDISAYTTVHWDQDSYRIFPAPASNEPGTFAIEPMDMPEQYRCVWTNEIR